jgi:hypothetical protein
MEYRGIANNTGTISPVELRQRLGSKPSPVQKSLLLPCPAAIWIERFPPGVASLKALLSCTALPLGCMKAYRVPYWSDCFELHTNNALT